MNQQEMRDVEHPKTQERETKESENLEFQGRGFADASISAEAIADVLEEEALAADDIMAAFGKAAAFQRHQQEEESVEEDASGSEPARIRKES